MINNSDLMLKNIITILAILITVISVSAQQKLLQKPDPSTISQTDESINFDTLPIESNKSHISTKTSFAPSSISFSESTPSHSQGLRAASRDKDNVAIMIVGTPDTKGRSGFDLASQGKDYLYAASEIMGITNPDLELTLQSIDEDELGHVHLTYYQNYKGIKVYGSEIKLHGSNNDINTLLGRYTATPNVEITPNVSVQSNETKVIAELGGIHLPPDHLNIFPIEPISTELVIYNGRLCYHSTVYTDLINRYEVFTDAHTSETIKSYKSICQFHNHEAKLDEEHTCSHAESNLSPDNDQHMSIGPLGDETANAVDLLGQTRTIHTYEDGGTYYMIDISRNDMFDATSNLPHEPEGVIWTIDAFNSSPENNDFNYDHVTSVNNNWSNTPVAVSSQFNGSLAYEYFLNNHTRISINGQKGNIISFVNVSDKQGGNMDNAFWNGFAMFYGNGSSAFKPLARGLDVAGHEMTHGVVQNTANLEYYGESGALNESFADIFGAMIDRDDWEIGEDVVNTSAFPSGALRSLINPNQGQPTNSFNTGWQPMHMNQKFNGQEDNNGVHINSGIPNHAFYQFANIVGKSKAENVYYRALDKYLVKSSQFIDARLAVIKAAQDLNLSAAEVQAARDAFDAVGILDGAGGDYQEDIEINPGENLIVYSSEDRESLSIMRPDGTIIAENFISVGVKSKPSVTDDGRFIVWVNNNNQVHLVDIDWSSPTFSFQSGILGVPDQSDNTNIRRVAVSRDGEKVAVLTNDFNNIIRVFDYPTEQWYDYELYNPTFSQDGEKTFDVAYADALEFDYSGDFIMYDALNQVQGLGGTINYYDIGFINVDNSINGTPGSGEISKLFSGLPDMVSVGNPTFSKNSEYIIAFDYGELQTDLNGDSFFTNFAVYGTNLENGDVNVITTNNTFGFPSYSTNDLAIVYTKIFEDNNPNTDFFDVAGYNLDASKIQASGDEVIVKEEGLFATWFSNGERDLVDVFDLENNSELKLQIVPNPVKDKATLTLHGDMNGIGQYTLSDIQGRIVATNEIFVSSNQSEIEISLYNLKAGIYNITLTVQGKSVSTRFIKL